jgi:hypothetical protein
MVTKAELHQIVDSLPENPTEDDLLYALYVRQSIGLGIEDWKAGRVVPLEEVKKSIEKWQHSTPT